MKPGMKPDLKSRGRKAAVLGAAGYAGGELLRLLDGHPEISGWVAISRSQAGRAVGEVHPGLAASTAAKFLGLSPREAAADCDILFLALEHGESGKLAAELLASPPALLIDLAADFRVRDRALHEKFYGRHPAPEWLPHFTYALADVAGESLAGNPALAVPGCFATAAQLALRPLARLPLCGPPALFAVTGSSGAGTRAKATTHHPARAHNLFAYSPLAHRHEAEIIGQWRAWGGEGEPRLLAHAGPFVRGIYLTLHARFSEAADVAAAFLAAYAGRPFIRLLDTPPDLTHAIGTNCALMHVAVSGDRREAQISVAIDNLLKGAAGQAIQAMNLALGWPETAGLPRTSHYPC